MKRLLILLGMAAFLAASTVLADAGDDDYDDDDTTDDDSGDDDVSPYTCEQFCQAADECSPTCVAADCATFCADEASNAQIACTALTTCGEFNTCVCDQGADDDAADDDTADDDDDDDSGCGMTRTGTAALLTVLMGAVGLSALILGTRRSSRR
jgi:hypothetical protein